eukprot:15335952-Ditylum_brightwellii.AAC.2
MEQYKYMRIACKLVPDKFMDEYHLHDKVHNGYIYMEIHQGLYGLPQAGQISNDLLCKCLAGHNYFKTKYTP